MAFPDLSVQETPIPYNYSVLWTNQSTNEDINLILRDREGIFINLKANTDYVALNAKEYPKDTTLAFSKVGVIGVDGSITISFHSADIPYPGVWYGEFVVSKVSDITDVTKRIKCFINTESAVSVTSQKFDPLTVSEVKTALMDRGEEDNALLDAEEWNDSQIAISIIKAVSIWNESPPASNYTYTQITFPYKSNWIDGVIGDLLHSRALNLVRNRMPSQAGGIVIDDKQRADVYLNLSQMYRDKYSVWCSHMKSALNMNNLYGSTYNPYYG
jgi:hypothetical protein